MTSFRKTAQYLLPPKKPAFQGYDLYPTFPLVSGHIDSGFEDLAPILAKQTAVILDGYAGVMWEDFRERLSTEFSRHHVSSNWLNINAALKSETEITDLTQPFMGNDDPLFGKRFNGQLVDFFDPHKLQELKPQPGFMLNIIYGTGAALAGWSGFLVYLDLPKNELQFRARAGLPTNLGLNQALTAKTAYKRSYFVDWPALNLHKQALMNQLDLIVDAQSPDAPTFARGQDLRVSLETMSQNSFRVRPWFEPGTWGGQWIKRHIPALPQNVPNYAWSFELITPENGLLFEDNGHMLEVSFDFLMFQNYENILGQAAPLFKYEFPIRFDWLDTVEGGNLSLQCHPSPDYIKTHFGERFTQDETYYILEASPDATVYLGFQEGVKPQEFKAALEHSFQHHKAVDIENFIQKHPAKKHDLFLIPHGTVHCSGKGSVVLEISATPYIFTFKMYDWLRLDLDGKPRPLNIARAFANLNFERQGEIVKTLIAKPCILESGIDWQIIHLSTHPAHFYDIERLEFSSRIQQATCNQCHILCLVEGEAITLETKRGMRRKFHYSETFAIPAACESYTLFNEGAGMAKVIKAFVKSGVSL